MTGHASDLDRYLRILAGADPTGRLIEIRSAVPGGAMRQTFTPATRPELAAKTITRLAARTDVYVGVLLRHRRGGGRDACEHSHLAFVEIDRPDGAQRLARYRCPPTMIVASGGSPGHAHAYWQLHEPVGLDDLETANRRLAIRLGGDLASVDAARILRPPTSWNWKRTPPTQRRAARAPRPTAATPSPSSPPASPTPPPSRDPRPRRLAQPPAISTGSCSRSPPPPTCQRSPAASPTEPAKSTARSTMTATPASSSTNTTGTAMEPAAPAAPSTTSARSSTACAPAAASSSSCASASPRTCCRSG